MKIFIILLLLICSTFKTLASTKQNIIQNLKDTQNFSFNFEQKINGKIENGNCKINFEAPLNKKRSHKLTITNAVNGKVTTISKKKNK